MTRATVTPIHGLSIQGERHASTTTSPLMTMADVLVFVQSLADPVLRCREGGHDFPKISEAGIRFCGTDDDGLFVRRLNCKSCGLVQRVEKWEGRGRGRNIRYRKIGVAYLDYDAGYLAPSGGGRATSRQIADALATIALAGKTPAQLRNSLRHDPHYEVGAS